MFFLLLNNKDQICVLKKALESSNVFMKDNATQNVDVKKEVSK